MRSGQDPDKWLLELDLLRIRLEETGSTVPDEDLIAHVISNLTQEYSELVTSLEGDLEGLKVEALKDRILSFHRRKTAEEYVELHYTQGNNRKMTQSLSRRQDRRTDRTTWKPGKDQYYWCLKKGHRVSQCRVRLNGKGSTRRPDGTYYQGKLSREMPEKKGDQNNSFMAASFCLEAASKETVMNSAEITEGITKTESEMWLVDSGCNKHISPHQEDFRNMRPTDITCIFGNKGQLRAEGIGEVEITTNMKGVNATGPETCSILLKGVLYIPGLRVRLLSSGCLRRSGGKFIESSAGSTLQMAGGRTVIPLKERGNFLWLKPYAENRKGHINTVYAPGGRETASASLLDWHETLGHCNPSNIIYLGQRGLINVTGEKRVSNFNCRLCKECKSTLPHYQRGTRSPKRPGECVHIDLVGPFSPDVEGHTYMIVSIDEATRYKRSYGLKNRAEAFTFLKKRNLGMTTSRM